MQKTESSSTGPAYRCCRAPKTLRLSAVLFAAMSALMSGCLAGGAGKCGEVRIMSYNIYHCEGADKKLDIPRTASVIAKERPDFVALQEVDNSTKRSRGFDQAGELGKALGMHSTFAKAITFGGGEYGIALLSKERPLSVRRIPLPGKEPRVLLLCEFADCWVGNAHLDLDPAARVESVKIIRDAVAAVAAHKAVFLAGDWNAEPDSEPLAAVRGFMKMLSPQNRRTYTGFKVHPPESVYCIDYIAVDSGHAGDFETGISYVVSDNVTSDHNPVVVSVKKSGR